jgi:hypothetical protein
VVLCLVFLVSAAWLTGQAKASTITFSEPAVAVPGGNGIFVIDGVTFTAPFQSVQGNGGPGGIGDAYWDVRSIGDLLQFRFTFAQPVTSATFDLLYTPREFSLLDLRLYIGGVDVIDAAEWTAYTQYTLPPAAGWASYTLTAPAGKSFTQIIVGGSPSWHSSGWHIGVDNLQTVAATPIPGAALLMLTALGTLGGIGMRRSRGASTKA